jgi:CheY-like chemotaxis protein
MKARILLVEDDPVSRAFLTAAIEGIPARVEAAESCRDALQRIEAIACDLWLIDANLPDGSGAGLLAALRRTSRDIPALAHTASREPADHAELLAAGFAEVLVKPLPAIALQEAICRSLGYDVARDGTPPGDTDAATRACARLPDWDDAAALSALKGEQSHVLALRGLFLSELASQCHAVDRALADGDTAAARGVLHMLRASCGFVGAARLGEATRVLEGDPRSDFARERFREAADELLAPLISDRA